MKRGKGKVFLAGDLGWLWNFCPAQNTKHVAQHWEKKGKELQENIILFTILEGWDINNNNNKQIFIKGFGNLQHKRIKIPC